MRSGDRRWVKFRVGIKGTYLGHYSFIVPIQIAGGEGTMPASRIIRRFLFKFNDAFYFWG